MDGAPFQQSVIFPPSKISQNEWKGGEGRVVLVENAVVVGAVKPFCRKNLGARGRDFSRVCK